MTRRTTVSKVTFAIPFTLKGFEAPLPAGTYEVETDEDLIEGVSFPAYQRTATTLHVGQLADRPGVSHAVTVDPNELDAAVAEHGTRTFRDPA